VHEGSYVFAVLRGVIQREEERYCVETSSTLCIGALTSAPYMYGVK
jgi:hypothetical protein